jgi:hypothetical protein
MDILFLKSQQIRLNHHFLKIDLMMSLPIFLSNPDLVVGTPSLCAREALAPDKPRALLIENEIPNFFPICSE